MKRRAFLAYGVIALCIWLAVGTRRACTGPPRFETLSGTGVVYFVTPEDDLLHDILPTFEVTRDALLLAYHGRLVEHHKPAGKDWGAALETHLLSRDFADVTSFAADAGGAVLAVRGREFLQIQTDGSMESLAELPAWDFRLAPGIESHDALLSSGPLLLRVSEHARRGDTDSEAEADVQVVARLEEPIVAVADSLDGTFVAGRSNIYQVVGDRVRRVINLPTAAQAPLGNFHREPLCSLAVTGDGRILFFSTEETIYALSGAVALRITDGLGGSLRWRDGVLFVLDPHRGWLVGITHLPELLGAAGA
jgi:hypothetical protein